MKYSFSGFVLLIGLGLLACGGGATTASPSTEGDAGSSIDNRPNNPADDAGTGTGNDASIEADAEAGVPDAGTDAEVKPEVPAVQFLGRFDTSSPDGPKVSWAGARIRARFSGTEVKATFNDTMAYTDYGPDRWEVVIDGASTMTVQLERTTKTYTLASGLAAGAHTIELWKLTEAMVGTTQFLGFEFPNGELLAPPANKTRHLEFIGDSGSNGYGIESGTANCPFTAATQNERKSYPALIANALDADHLNLAASGKGLYYNSYRPDTETFGIIYPRALTFSPDSQWNFSGYTPDVVWLTLGGLDYNDPDYDVSTPPDPPPPGAFQAKYIELVTTIRAKYPNAHVFCSVAPSLNDNYPAGYNAYTNVKTAVSNVVSTRAAAGDSKVYYFEFTRAVGSDYTACNSHIGAAKHQSMSVEAAAFIRQKTQWL